jgi:methylmalonyl-CoA/ethylmalonyl-CoA epimerase
VTADPVTAAVGATEATTAATAAATAALVQRFDHVAVAVWDLAEAVPLYRDLLGGELISGGDDDRLHIRTLQLRYPPGVKVELMQPLREDSYLAAYLRRHGPGFHHMTCFVADVAEAAQRLTAAGFETVDTATGNPWWRETFVRPSSGFGTLIQLAATDLEWTRPVVPEGATVEDVLAGRLVWERSRPRWRGTP